jgi:hypothetical protein
LGAKIRKDLEMWRRGEGEIWRRGDVEIWRFGWVSFANHLSQGFGDKGRRL